MQEFSNQKNADIMNTNDITNTNYDTLKLRAQVCVLKDVAKEYSGRTIENIISNLEARIKAKEGQG